MPSAYSGSEIVEIAIQIEVCGEAFYDEALKHLKDKRIREVFEYLVEEEKHHAVLFQKMLSQLTDTSAEWRQSDEYVTYMRALAENRVFPTPEAAREVVRGLADDRAAVQFALRFEKDTVLFFHELRTMVKEKDQEVVDQLIAEEQKHVRRLNGLLKTLG